jgi:tRNA (guanine-N7-)-methyltransferase
MKHHPYAAIAPRLPEAKQVDPRELVASGGRPIELEIGPGRGGFLFERVQVDPSLCVIGLEIRLKWATLVDRRLHDKGFGTRARVFAEDARLAIERFPDACLAVVYLHFPDPWWKKRHQKRLVMGEPLLEQLSRTIVPGGQVFMQTDVEERALGFAQLFAGSSQFSAFGAEPQVPENPFVARSPRERRAMADGLPIFRLHYRRA